MGEWNDAYERLIDLQNSGASVEEVEAAASVELDQLLED